MQTRLSSLPSTLITVIGLAAALLPTARAFADQTLDCTYTTSPPVIDGNPEDSAWAASREIVTTDRIAGIDHRLRCAWDGARVYILATFPDVDENRDHKTLHWSADEQRYRVGPEREDTLVLKWNLEPFPVDLGVDSEDSYRADIWFWKARRTDPAGFADDKLQVYSPEALDDATPVLSKSYRQFYLLRESDAGRSAYEQVVPNGYEGDRVESFRSRTPQGSRADVQARGQWHDGTWRVEFARTIATQDTDDIQFTPGLDYQFGISRYEIAGRPADPTLEIPLYGSGDVGESLFLVLEPQPSP